MKSFTHCPVCNESLAESGMSCKCARSDRLANFLRTLDETLVNLEELAKLEKLTKLEEEL